MRQSRPETGGYQHGQGTELQGPSPSTACAGDGHPEERGAQGSPRNQHAGVSGKRLETPFPRRLPAVRLRSVGTGAELARACCWNRGDVRSSVRDGRRAEHGAVRGSW